MEFGVKFNFDDGGISDSIAKTGREFEKASKLWKENEKIANESLRSVFGNAMKTEKELTKMVIQSAQSSLNASSKLDLAKQSMQDFGNVAQKSFGGIKDFLFGNLLAGGITGLINGFINLGKSIIDAGSNFEKTTVTFTNAFGDKQLAQDYIELIQNFAAKTPFEFDKLTASVLKLTNRGFTPTREELTKMGDLAATTGKDFDQLAEAILDAQTGEFERLKEFGIRASKDGDKVTLAFKGQVKEIENTEIAIREAIIAYGALEGVQGTMTAQSKTFQGVMSNLKDTLNQAGIKIFNVFGPTLNDSISFVIDKFGSLTQIVSPLWTSFDNLFKTVFQGTSTTEVLGKTWEFVEDVFQVAVQSIKYLVDGLDKTIKWMRSTSQETSFLGSSFRVIGNIISSVQKGFLNLPAFIGGALASYRQFIENLKNMNFDIGIGDAFEKEFLRIKATNEISIESNQQLNEKDAKTELEILNRRNTQTVNAVKKNNNDKLKLEKEFQSELKKLYENIESSKRKNQLDEIDESSIDGKIKKLKLQKQFDDEDLAQLMKASIAKAQTLAERNELIDGFNKLRLINDEAYNKRVLDLETKAIEDYNKLIKASSNETNEIIKKSKQSEEKARLDLSLKSIERYRDLRVQELDDELKNGNLSVKQTKEIEKQKLKIILEGLTAKRKAYGLTVNSETIKLDGLIKETQKAIDNFGNELDAKKAGDFFKNFLKDSLNINDDQLGQLKEGFNALKTAIADVINQGYESEIAAIDDVINTRKDKISELESLIEEEFVAKQNGYANSYDALVSQKANEEALVKADNAKKVALQKEQLKTTTAIQAAEQVGALITAVANMTKEGSKFGIFGLPLIAASIIGMFALYKSYKSQAAALTKAFKGGRVSDYLNQGVMGRTDRGNGRGHRVEDTNMVIGANEFIMNEESTSANLPFLRDMNSGIYDNANLKALLNTKTDGQHLSDFKAKQQKEYKRQSEVAIDKVVNKLSKEMEEYFNTQTTKIIDDNSKRPTVINMPDGSIKMIYHHKNGEKIEIFKQK